jgi:Family of unknown function (DUF6282)
LADQRSQPSDRARELVRGAYDTHIHIAPDLAPRRITDIQLARRFQTVGLAGFILKSHYQSTAARAAVVREAVPGVRALGAIALNRAVGGLNSVAVEVAAREGARTVWFPTVSSENEHHEVLTAKPGDNVPAWVKLALELREQGIRPEPVAVMSGNGGLLPEAREVLAMIARHDMVLATGHLARDEIFALVDAGLAAGIRDVVVTHPDFPSQDLSIEDQQALAARGALIERCFTTPHTGKTTWERVIDGTRAVGVERTVWSTDLGQVFNPPVEDGLPLMADRFLEAGFSEEEIRVMAVDNTRRVAGG